DPGNITRKKIRCKLYSFKRKIQCLRERSHHHRLSHTWKIFEQDMPFGEKCDEKKFNFLILSDNHSAYIFNHFSFKAYDMFHFSSLSAVRLICYFMVISKFFFIV